MLTPLKTAASIILFFRENSEYKNSHSWIEWRETVLSIYENQLQHGAINAAINAGKISLKKIKTVDDAFKTLENFSEDEKSGLMSLLELYKIIDENQSSFIPGTFNVEKWNEISTAVNLSSEKLLQAKTKSANWYKLQKENKFRTEVYVPANIKPILVDFSLRCITLWIFQRWLFDSLNDDRFYWFSQVFFIPVAVFIYSFFRDRKIISATQMLIEKIQMQNIRLKIQNSAWNYLLVFILAVSGSCVALLIRCFDLDAALLFLFIPAYGIYLLILQTNFSKSLPNYLDIKQQIEDREHCELSGDLTPDQNDEEIVNLEVNLKAENERMNAYIIEAVLFAALAFTGFVTILTTGNFSYEFIDQFNHHVFRLLQNFIDSNGENLADSYLFLFSKNGIIVVLSYELLFCAVFFLSVIASRLRYFKLTDYIDRFLQLSKSMNEKEENLLQYDKNNIDEIKKYNSKIKDFLREGYKMQDKIFPIMEYMQFFRTLGIFMFFMVIVTGGLFISTWLSFVLMFISALSVFYFQIGRFKTAIKLFYISMQEFYYKVDSAVHWVCWSMIIIALFLRTFAIPGGGPTMILGFTLLFLHYMLNLFIPVQFDYEVKKDNVFGSGMAFHKLLAYIFKIALAVFFMGYMFKSLHLPGASVMIIASAIMMSMYFLFSKKIVQGPRWLEYLLSVPIFTAILALLFKIQHLPGASLLVVIAIPLMIIAAVITYLYKQKIRPLIKRTMLVLLVLCLSFFSMYINSAIWNLSFNYSAFEKRQKLRVIENVVHDPTFKIERDSLLKHLEEFNNAFVYVHNIEHYEMLNNLAWAAYETSDDSVILNNALIWSKETLSGPANWLCYDTYSALLYKLKRYEEAKKFAEEAYRKGNDSGTKELLNKIDSALADTTLVLP